MKRTYLLLTCTLLCGLLAAENVPMKQAQDFARTFFEQHTPNRSASSPQLQMVWDGEDNQSRSNSIPAFYVFNRTDRPGFVIVAGDDIAMPVLGYSLENNFKTENMPDNIRYWLLGIREQINEARQDHFQPSSRTVQSWDSRAANIGEVVLEVPSAKWDQTEYYKEECPIIDGQRAITGCTATAMAIVLKAREWPDKGEGTIPAYSYQWEGRTYNIPSQELGHSYDWDLMPMKLTASSTPEQRKQVATLMRDCGLMSKAEYTTIDTGADCVNSIQGLIQFMKYSPNAIHGFNDMFSKEEWHQLIREELHENGPVFYTCNWHDGSGHAFVLDGYTTADFYRVNWGWSGYSDGYYLLSALNASEQGFASDMNDYSRLQTAFFRLKQRQENEVNKGKLILKEGSTDQDSFDGISVDILEVKQQVEFTVNLGYISCINNTFSGKIVISMLNRNGEWKEDVSLEPIIIPSLQSNNDFLCQINCKITQNIEVGDYLAARYQNSGSNEWEIMTGAEHITDKLTILDNNTTYTGVLSLNKSDNLRMGIYMTSDALFAPNQPFTIPMVGNIINEGEENFTGYVTLSVFDQNDQWKEDVLQEERIIYGLSKDKQIGLAGLQGTITKEIEEGDYLAVRYRYRTDTEWKRMEGRNGTNDHILLKTNADQLEKLIYLKPGEYDGHYYRGIETDVKQVEENKEFTVYAGLMHTVRNKFFNGTIGICLFDKEGNVKEKIDQGNWTLSGQGTLSRFGKPFLCLIGQTIESGDYLAMAYKSVSYPHWVEVEGEGDAITRVVIKAEEGKEEEDEDEDEDKEKDETLIAQSTQFTYNRTSKIIKIKTLKGVSYQLTDDKGIEIMNGTLTGSESFSIVTSDLQAGTYHLTIENEESRMKTSFVIGEPNSKNQ